MLKWQFLEHLSAVQSKLRKALLHLDIKKSGISNMIH